MIILVLSNPSIYCEVGATQFPEVQVSLDLSQSQAREFSSAQVEDLLAN